MTLTSISIMTAKKTVIQKASTATAVSLLLTGALLAASSLHAAPEMTINSAAGGSTTIVEQYSDGKTATITTTPNGITMQDGMPYAVTQVTTVPRYTVRQSGNNTVLTQGSTAVTSVPVTDRATNSKVDVITTPVNTNAINTATTQVLPVATASQLPVINTPATTVTTNQPVNNQPATTQIVSSSLDTLQLTPTFSTPDIVQAQTKVMKILKNKDGREVAVPANHIAPGDVIEYHTTYTNTTTQPVNDINAMVSLPSGVQLVSLNSLATTGGDSYQTIQQVGNTVVIKENYSGLKWNLVNLDANAAQTVVIRAKVQ